MTTRDSRKTKSELLTELQSLRQLVADMQKTPASTKDEYQYRHLVRFFPEAIWISCNETIVYANDAAVRLLVAKSPDELIGRHLDDFILPHDRERVAERRKTLLATGTVPMEEQKRLRLDGSVVDIDIIGISIKWQGKPAILTVLQDITSRVQHRRALLEGERRLAALAGLQETDCQNQIHERAD